MRTRRLLAMATLTGLLLSIGVLPTAPMGAGTELASHAQQAAPHAPSAHAPAVPQWGYAWGMNRTEAAIFGVFGVATCLPFMWFGAAACGFTGVA